MGVPGADPELDVVGVARTVEEGEALVRATRPDVAIVDGVLPDGDGADAAVRCREAHPAVQVLVLTGRSDQRALVAAIEAGCAGFVTRDRALSELVGAVRVVHSGEADIEPAMLANLLPRVVRREQGLGSDLSAREREVLGLLAEGRSNQAVADRLRTSVHTVRNHVQDLIVKLHAHAKLEAVAIATRDGLLDPRRGGHPG